MDAFYRTLGCGTGFSHSCPLTALYLWIFHFGHIICNSIFNLLPFLNGEILMQKYQEFQLSQNTRRSGSTKCTQNGNKCLVWSPSCPCLDSLWFTMVIRPLLGDRKNSQCATVVGYSREIPQHSNKHFLRTFSIQHCVRKVRLFVHSLT